MKIVNKLTKPGDIRRVDLTPDIVRIETMNGQTINYSLVLAGQCMKCGRDLHVVQCLDYVDVPCGKVCMPCHGGS